MRELIRELQAGTFAFPHDVSMARLERDVLAYQETYGQVTLDEAVNAGSLDDLYERLFIANRMDTLDLLFLRFIWTNHSRALSNKRSAEARPSLLSASAPMGMNASSSSNRSQALNISPPAVEGGVEPTLKMAVARNSSLFGWSAHSRKLRSMVSTLYQMTEMYARWEKPIEHKISVFNASGSADIRLSVQQGNSSFLGVDYYNSASGRARKIDVEVPDAEYLLAEILSIEDEFLVDDKGQPLPDDEAQAIHQERSSLEDFREVLQQLQQATMDSPELVQEAPENVTDSTWEDEGEEEISNAPPLRVVLSVSCAVAVVMLFSMLAPQRWLPQVPQLPDRAASWARRALAWTGGICALRDRILVQLRLMPAEVVHDDGSSNNNMPTEAHDDGGPNDSMPTEVDHNDDGPHNGVDPAVHY